MVVGDSENREMTKTMREGTGPFKRPVPFLILGTPEKCRYGE